MSTTIAETRQRLDDLRARHAVYCGSCLREDVPVTVYWRDSKGTDYRICAPCKRDQDRRKAARETAAPLVLEYLRTRRAVLRESDAQIYGSLEIDLDAEPSEVFLAARDAEKALVAFLGGTYAAVAVVDELDHHFAADYSEIHGYGQTLAFTAELDRVLLADGKDAFQRYCDEHQEN